MADQTVTLVLDAAQYYREIGKITGETDKFKGSTDRTGESLDGLRLKTEGRVAANIGAIARSFSAGGSAADILALAVTRVSESFRGSLLFAGAATAGVGLYELIVKTGEAMIKLDSDVKNLTRSRGTSDFLGTDDINKNLNDISDKLNELFQRAVERNHSLLSTLLGTGGGGPLSGIIPALDKADQDKANQLTVKAGEDINELAEKTEKLNRVEEDRSRGLELRATLEDNEIKRLERLGAIARTAQLAGVSGRPASNAADTSFNNVAFGALKQASLNGNISPSSIGAYKQEFFNRLTRPFKTGALDESFAQEAERLSQAQSRQGDPLEAARLHRLALEYHGRAEGKQAGDKLFLLDQLKFEGLITVDQLKFEGLQILDGLKISIQ